MAHFGNLSGLDYVHPQPTKPCFSVSKRPPLTEKKRLLPCGLLPARLCATPHLVTSARQPQVAPAGGKGEQGNHNVPSAALTELQFPVSVFKGSWAQEFSFSFRGCISLLFSIKINQLYSLIPLLLRMWNVLYFCMDQQGHIPSVQSKLGCSTPGKEGRSAQAVHRVCICRRFWGLFLWIDKLQTMKAINHGLINEYIWKGPREVILSIPQHGGRINVHRPSLTGVCLLLSASTLDALTPLSI